MATRASKTPGIVTGYIKLWPRECFQLIGDQHETRLLVNELQLLRKPGVYVLYRDDQPYYVGRATKTLFKRLHDHANKVTDDYYHFWNWFSAFIIENRDHIKAVEGILINAMPTANGARPRMKKIPLPPEIRKRLRANVDPRDILARVDTLRRRKPRMHITEEFLRAAKNEGRP